MDELISKKAVTGLLFGRAKSLRGTYGDLGGACAGAARLVEKLSPARFEPKKGRWTRDNACSECGYQPWFSGDIHNYSFCPNCGADMRGEQG